jgi:putative membrane protein
LLRRLEVIKFTQARNFDFLDAGIVPHISNRKIASMKNKFTIISRLAIIAIVAGSLSVIGTGRAQQDTSIGTNPHLRAQSAPTTSPSANVKMSQKDVSFIQKAAGRGQQEVENGKMAETKGQSAEVKRIGARMAAEHTKANTELTALAKRKGVTFDTRGVKAQDLGTADFDRQYLALLEATHKDSIADFEREAKNGDDRDLKAWASKTLPTLKEHLAMVKSAMKK